MVKNTSCSDSRIGFMQGRLSPLVDGKIQAFPYGFWQSEFELAAINNYRLIELTLDYEDPFTNPLMSNDGRSEILELSRKFRVKTPSVTGDCFMQKPFWKAAKLTRHRLIEDFYQIIEACGCVGASFLVVPLVDDGKISSSKELEVLTDVINEAKSLLLDSDVKIVFESDFGPNDLAVMIKKFDPMTVGINYDVGNSASLGYDPYQEILAYGHRVLNVHVKDRPFGGSTVPLGEGDADYSIVFKSLAQLQYKGNFILQTARAKEGKHLEDLNGYRDFTARHIQDNFDFDGSNSFS
jgi:L-ribulose-5-phosphate 3-epimerase